MDRSGKMSQQEPGMSKAAIAVLVLLGVVVVVSVAGLILAAINTRSYAHRGGGGGGGGHHPQPNSVAGSDAVGSVVNNNYYYGSSSSASFLANGAASDTLNGNAKWVPNKVCQDDHVITAAELMTLVGGANVPPPAHVVIIDVAKDLANFTGGHINGARFLDWKIDLAEIPYPANELYELPKKADFQASLRRVGVDYTKTIILTDNFLNTGKAFNRLSMRAYFVFKYFGFDNVYILNGGNRAWAAIGGQFITGTPSVVASTVVLGAERVELIADFGMVRDNLHNDKVTIVDARPHLMYYGWNFTCIVNASADGGFTCSEHGPYRGGLIHVGKPVARGGHILNAVSFPWSDNFVTVTETTPVTGTPVSVDYLKPTAQLYQLYQPIFKPNQLIILSCNEGVHAVTDWFIINEVLCFKNTLVYEGSAGEWAVKPLYPNSAPYTAPMVSGYDRYNQEGTTSPAPFTIFSP